MRTISLALVLIIVITPMSVLADHEADVLHGTVFDDMSEDGIFDDGVDDGIAGVTIELFVTGEATPLVTTTTSLEGSYEFTTIESGDYTVVVEDLVGYDDSDSNSYDFTVDGLADIPTIDFGKIPLAEGSISGIVYDDMNRDGEFNGGDVVLADVGIELFGKNDAEFSATTDEFGFYEFTGLYPGPYTVIETDPEDFYSTTPNTVAVTLPEEDSMDVVVDFGDFIPAEGEFPRLDLMLMKFFDISLLEFQALRDMEGWGYGNIAKAYFIAQLSDTALGDILGLRETMGWGRVMKEIMGNAGLKGYNLGLIVSGRTVPNSIQRLIDSCASIDTPEQVQELYATGANHGSIKKACRLTSEAGGNFDTLVTALGLLKVHSQKQVREMLMEENTDQFGNGDHGPPACKGKNKNDEGCN
jgi:hypothetical protein